MEAGQSEEFNDSKKTSGSSICKSGTQTLKSQKLEDTMAHILSDVPNEVLNNYDESEACRPDYKAAIFPRSRPSNAPFTPPNPSFLHEEETVGQDDLFFFESDHLALKGNEDYLNLLKNVAVLQALRTQAIKDLEGLLIDKKKALEDPIGYVAKLQNGDLPEYPGPLAIPEIPKIDFSKYKVVQPDEDMRPSTRHSKTGSQHTSETSKDESDKLLVRGRVYNESKPETFNKLWTNEEQRRLEELLLKYPPEEIEMKRWTKIANELGNRTPKQVCSRVQKYFLKLTKAGLPIPGRMPKMKNDRRFSIRARNNLTTKRSTFFPHEHIYEDYHKETIPESSNNGLEFGSIKIENKNDPMHIELLRQAKNEKIDEIKQNYPHEGYKCYICGQEPIKNTRWQCSECPGDINLCTNCALAQLEDEDPLHPFDHPLVPHKPPTFSMEYDTDYMPHKFSKGSYNYLDPNFLPE